MSLLIWLFNSTFLLILLLNKNLSTSIFIVFTDCLHCTEAENSKQYSVSKRRRYWAFLKNIKVDKSLGPDGIYPRILREAKEEIAGALTEIFVSSLASGEVPEDWRIANVVPLFKKGRKDNPGNYRPVSLTSVVGKLLEKIVRDRIYSHLEINGHISERQHGFMKGRSCLNNLIEDD